MSRPSSVALVGSLALSLAATPLAACSVPELDLAGRPCPCVDGYVCDTGLGVCVAGGAPRDGGDVTDAGARDGGVSDAGGSGCVFYDGFDVPGLGGWMPVAGSWSVVGGEAVQSDEMFAERAFMTADATEGLDNVRIRVRMRQLRGATGGAIEVDFHVDRAANFNQYFCNYEPNFARTGAMRLMWQTDAESGFLSERVMSDRSFDPFAPVTMAIELRGPSFRCLLEERPDSELSGSDTRHTGGHIGFKTYAMAAAYDWIEVCPLPP